MNLKHLTKSYRGNIKIDIDHKKIPQLFYDRYEELLNYFPICKRAYKKSPSGKGWHIRIQLKYPITVAEALFIQIFLCSDINREYMNFMRIINGSKFEDWNILFDKKTEVTK